MTPIQEGMSLQKLVKRSENIYDMVLGDFFNHRAVNIQF